jgi:DNA mismatch repair ATPase MutS
MAGKSTFLKALALSQAFASGLGLAFARDYVCGSRLVISSMTNSDDILGGRSRYLVEAERILSILRRADEGCLAVVDEILVGTNSEDRIAASIRILLRLARGPSLAVAATHDLPIAHGLESAYDLHHFSENLGGTDLSFDYKLKPGIVDKKNALRILKQLGFDDEILGI